MIRSITSCVHKGPKNTQKFRISKSSISTLVVGDHDNLHVDSGTLAAVTAAKLIGGTTSLVFPKITPPSIIEEARRIDNVNKVITLESLPENVYIGPEKITSILASIVQNYTHVLASSNNNTKSYIPRVAAQLNSSPLTEVCQILGENTFKRPMYAGNVLATVQMSDPIKFLLIRSTSFDKAGLNADTASAQTVKCTLESRQNVVLVTESDMKKGDKPDLNTAKVVVSGGRGMKNSENFALLHALADKLGGAVGASRAAVDAGFISNDCQVGQTGKIVAPDLYIAVGISGAIQHLSGMKDSKTIVAINKDKEAPIFQVADYGVVGDLFKVVPELTSKL